MTKTKSDWERREIKREKNEKQAAMVGCDLYRDIGKELI